MSEKLTKSQRENIIFKFLKTGEQDPLYEVQQTKFGKYFIKARPIEIEEEEEMNESEHEKQKLKPVKTNSINNESNDEYDSDENSSSDEEELIRHKNKTNIMKRKRAKQDAKRILDALTNLINSNESSDDETPRAPPLVEPTNFNPQQLSFRRRRLAF